MERWIGKLAIITGASSAIGLKTAEILVVHGMKVVGLAKDEKKLEKLSKSMAGKKGKLYAYNVDLTKEDEIKAAFKWSLDKIGPVNILVNCGEVVIKSSLMDGPIEAWKQMWETNVLGLSIATREAINIMKEENGKGHIVHINSIHGHSLTSFYGPEKFALTYLTEQLRTELNRSKTEIKVTIISPGLVGSNVSNNISPDVVDCLKNSPVLNPADVIDAIMYAISRPPHVQIHDLIIKPTGEIL